MIKDENEDPSLPKNSDRGGKRLMERNMRTGAFYLRPSVLCLYRRRIGGHKKPETFQKKKKKTTTERRKEGDIETRSEE